MRCAYSRRWRLLCSIGFRRSKLKSGGFSLWLAREHCRVADGHVQPVVVGAYPAARHQCRTEQGSGAAAKVALPVGMRDAERKPRTHVEIDRIPAGADVLYPSAHETITGLSEAE